MSPPLTSFDFSSEVIMRNERIFLLILISSVLIFLLSDFELKSQSLSKIDSVGIYLSSQDCISCNSAYVKPLINKIKIIKKLFNFKLIIISKEKITTKLTETYKKYEVDAIIDLSSLPKNLHQKFLKINAPAIVLFNEEVIINEINSSCLLKEEFDIDEIVQKSLKVQFRLNDKITFSSDEFTKIDKIFNNYKRKEIVFNDDISNCIFKIKYSDTDKLTQNKLFCLDNEFEAKINLKRDTIISEKLLPKSKIEGFTIDDTSLIVFIRYYYQKAFTSENGIFEIHNYPKVSYTSSSDNFIEIFNTPNEYEIFFDNIIKLDTNYLVNGFNRPECNNFPFYENPDSTFFLLLFDSKLQKIKPLLKLSHIIDNYDISHYYNFFSSKFFPLRNNKVLVVSNLNNTFLILDFSKKNDIKVIPISNKSYLSLFRNEMKKLELNPKKLIEEPQNILKGLKIYYLDTYVNNDKICFLFYDNTKDIFTIDIFDIDGKFIFNVFFQLDENFDTLNNIKLINFDGDIKIMYYNFIEGQWKIKGTSSF